MSNRHVCRVKRITGTQGRQPRFGKRKCGRPSNADEQPEQQQQQQKQHRHLSHKIGYIAVSAEQEQFR